MNLYVFLFNFVFNPMVEIVKSYYSSYHLFERELRCILNELINIVYHNDINIT